MMSSSSTVDDFTVAHLRFLLEKANIRVPPKTRKITLFDLAASHHLLAGTEETSGESIEVLRHGSDASKSTQDVVAELAALIDKGARKASISYRNRPAESLDSSEATPSLRNTPLMNTPSVYDDISYLAPGLDAFTLPAPRLRNILLTHEVSYQMAKTKADLVRLFNEEIAPRAEATLRAMENVKATDEGIMDAKAGLA